MRCPLAGLTHHLGASTTMGSMAAPGWYPDANAPGTLRWWDGTRWSEHTIAAVPPAPQPRLRPDGTVKGPKFPISITVLLGGIGVMVLSAAVVVPALLDSINGPRFDVPGARTLDLGEGAWVIYERTGVASRNGGTAQDTSRAVSIGPSSVSVEGPAPVDVRSDLTGLTQTIRRGDATYTGAVRLEIETSGEYQITVERSARGEVLVARPVTDVLSRWPWLVAFAIGGGVAVAGLVMWVGGAANRRTARRTGHLPG